MVVEKPLADNAETAALMVAAAAKADRILMIDHTFCYTPAVGYIRDVVASGELGEILYVDSVRINLGLIQPDVDVFWDLAPHDLSILDYILPGGLDPKTVSASGADPLGAGKACIGYLTMPLASGGIAHVNVNWLSPTKIRQMVIGGSKRTLVWDDLNPQQRISIHDRGVDLASTQASTSISERTAMTVSYRMGDIVVPALPGEGGPRQHGHRVRRRDQRGPRRPEPTVRPACACCPCWKPSARAFLRDPPLRPASR